MYTLFDCCVPAIRNANRFLFWKLREEDLQLAAISPADISRRSLRIFHIYSHKSPEKPTTFLALNPQLPAKGFSTTCLSSRRGCKKHCNYSIDSCTNWDWRSFSAKGICHLSYLEKEKGEHNGYIIHQRPILISLQEILRKDKTVSYFHIFCHSYVRDLPNGYHFELSSGCLNMSILIFCSTFYALKRIDGSVEKA